MSTGNASFDLMVAVGWKRQTREKSAGQDVWHTGSVAPKPAVASFDGESSLPVRKPFGCSSFPRFSPDFRVPTCKDLILDFFLTSPFVLTSRLSDLMSLRAR
jgi:hypothetical protein